MIAIKSSAQIEAMRESGRLLARARAAVIDAAKPGVTTADLDALAEEIIRKHGGIPTFQNYRGFPASICASVNEEVVHGIPGNRRLMDGDLLSIDFGVTLGGMITDAADTVGIGTISPKAQRLMDITRESFYRGIACARVGNRLSDISHAIGTYAEANGCGVVRALCGHGVGETLHEEPEIPNFGRPGHGVRLAAGMTLAIEPMITAGTWRVKTLENDWTVVTLDGSLAAHYEHTVLITEGEPELLTLGPEGGLS